MLDFSKSYFELFGLPATFEVDTEALAEHYRELQRVVHPDRYASASAQERRLAVQGASHINAAYETLKAPLARARYLLSLLGVDDTDSGGNTTDPMFLMEQMELREALAEARGQPDPYAVIGGVMARLREQEDGLIAELTTQFHEAAPGQLEAATDNVRKLQFLEKLRHDAEELEAALDDELM